MSCKSILKILLDAQRAPLPALPGKHLMGYSGLGKSQSKDEGFIPFQQQKAIMGEKNPLHLSLRQKKMVIGDEGRRL